MPRPPRLFIAGIPQHIIQRGNNREPCFYHPHDYQNYLAMLEHASKTMHCTVHAYVLMTNHVHLLATGVQSDALPRMMQTLGRRYVSYINLRYQRTGTLWEGRYKACLVDSDDYLLTCYRYIELNPVRAGMCAGPGDYPWSSYRFNGLGHPSSLITPHPSYLSLHPLVISRQQTYRSLFTDRLTDQQLTEIREYTQQQRAYGSKRFQDTIEAHLGRIVHTRPRGWPTCSTKEE